MKTNTTNHPSHSNSFGRNLKALRKKNGLTQGELAYLIGVHETTIRRWESNDKSTPRLEEVRKLAEVLHVSEQGLLSVEDSSPPRWVLTIKIAQEFTEEVIDMSRSVPRTAAITTTPTGGYLSLGGDYSLWTDDNNFKKFISDLKKFRSAVIQNGRALGGIKD